MRSIRVGIRPSRRSEVIVGSDRTLGLLLLLAVVLTGVALQLSLVPRQARAVSFARHAPAVPEASPDAIPVRPAVAPPTHDSPEVAQAAPTPSPEAARVAGTVPVIPEPVGSPARRADGARGDRLSPADRVPTRDDSGHATPGTEAVAVSAGRSAVAGARDASPRAPAGPPVTPRGDVTGRMTIAAPVAAAIVADTPESSTPGPASPASSEETDSAGTPPAEETPAQPAIEPTLVLSAPAVGHKGRQVEVRISVEQARGISHAPLRLRYDPAILEFVSALEGKFLSAGGARTVFLASPSSTPGLMFIAISRMPPAGGADGSGELCTVTFLAKTAGESAIDADGSRLLDHAARTIDMKRSDTHVVVQ